MSEFTMPLLGWFLYAGVPVLMLVGTFIWYWSRQRKPRSTAQRDEDGDSA